MARKAEEDSFLAKNERDFKRKIRLHPGEEEYVIQEYIVGVPMVYPLVFTAH